MFIRESVQYRYGKINVNIISYFCITIEEMDNISFLFKFKTKDYISLLEANVYLNNIHFV